MMNAMSLYYQLANKEITSTVYWDQVMPHLVSIITPTEVYIFNEFEKYGMYAVAAILILFWGITRTNQREIR